MKDRKPRYIENLLKHAEIRNREKERRLERQVQKDREAEGDEFADKESFVTSAYRKKMEEMQKQEEEERKQDLVRDSFINQNYSRVSLTGSERRDPPRYPESIRIVFEIPVNKTLLIFTDTKC